VGLTRNDLVIFQRGTNFQAVAALSKTRHLSVLSVSCGAICCVIGSLKCERFVDVDFAMLWIISLLCGNKEPPGEIFRH
jgi:hypothetical protein